MDADKLHAPVVRGHLPPNYRASGHPDMKKARTFLRRPEIHPVVRSDRENRGPPLSERLSGTRARRGPERLKYRSGNRYRW